MGSPAPSAEGFAGLAGEVAEVAAGLLVDGALEHWREGFGGFCEAFESGGELFGAEGLVAGGDEVAGDGFFGAGGYEGFDDAAHPDVSAAAGAAAFGDGAQGDDVVGADEAAVAEADPLAGFDAHLWCPMIREGEGPGSAAAPLGGPLRAWGVPFRGRAGRRGTKERERRAARGAGPCGAASTRGSRPRSHRAASGESNAGGGGMVPPPIRDSRFGIRDSTGCSLLAAPFSL